MGYTAQIIEKQRQDGQLHVLLEYTNGTDTFRERMTSRSGQGGGWIKAEVARRIAELDGLDALETTIAPGPVDGAPEPVAEPTTETPRQKYERKLREFDAWLNALRQGVVTADRPAFVELKQWLRDKWRDDYIDLFLR